MTFIKAGFTKKQKVEVLRQFRSRLNHQRILLEGVKDPKEAYYLRKVYQEGLHDAYFYTGSLVFDSYEEMEQFYESEGFGELGNPPL